MLHSVGDQFVTGRVGDQARGRKTIGMGFLNRSMVMRKPWRESDVEEIVDKSEPALMIEIDDRP